MFDDPMNSCHRSSTAWPRLGGVPARWHLACSRAKIQDLYAGQMQLGPDNRGQIERLADIQDTLEARGENVNVVTLTIGGNDFGFADKLGDCFFQECFAHIEDDLQAIADLEDPLITVLSRVRAATSDQARIVLVGYPRIFPATDEGIECFWLSDVERVRANYLAERLDTIMSNAAELEAAEFLSVSDALAGHELCTADSWLFELNPLEYGRDQRQAHPLPSGQAAILDRVNAIVGA